MLAPLQTPAALRRQLLACFIACLALGGTVGTWATQSWAGPNDTAARRAITAAMDEYAKSKDADAAEGALLEAIAVCGSDCKPAVLAQAWMYIGLVKGSGQKDWDTAREAFSVALGFDDKITLDPRFFNPTAQALFDGIKNQQEAKADPAKVVAGFEPGTLMGCVPLVQEIEAYRPLPISCSTKVQGVDGVVLRYRQYGAERWTRVDLKREGDEWRGQIPCTVLDRAGTTWGMYVEARDARDNALERIGSRDKPLVFKVVEKSSEPPPSIPGEPPPDKCIETAYCPEEMIGTPACEALKGNGPAPKDTSCDSSSDCDLGMSCNDGVCRAPDVCVEDRDCKSDYMCQAGLCIERPRPEKRDWFGLHFGTDFASVPASASACEPDGEFACFDNGELYEGTPYPGSGGTVPGGLQMGTMRVMFSYDRFLLDNLSLGARFGFAFSGAPEDFFPLHFEGRGTYYFGNVTQGRSTFVPYLALGFGLAQVDSKVPVQMVDCRPEALQECLAAPQVDEQLVNPETGAARLRTLDAYKSFGTVFASVSPGLMLALTRELSAVANVSVLLMTEEQRSTSLVIDLQPSLGVQLGF